LINIPKTDVFARVPEVAAQTDPVLKQLDRLLDDDKLYQQVRDEPSETVYMDLGAWAAFHAGGSAAAHADLQTFVSVEKREKPKSE
jgi:hypothetical protein